MASLPSTLFVDGSTTASTPSGPVTTRTHSYGIVEGFHGRPWSSAQRCQLIDNITYSWKNTLNTYVYAPKSDRYRVGQWRIPLERDDLKEMADLIQQCQYHAIHFIYAIAPGTDITYSSDDDRRALLSKIDQLHRCGGTATITHQPTLCPSQQMTLTCLYSTTIRTAI
jgi:hypothetical protein